MTATSPVGYCNPLTSTFNSVTQKVYSVRNTFNELCTTDNKVYAFLILGRLLQAAALVSFSVSVASTFFVGPIALVWAFSSAVLGLIGTDIAGDPEKVNGRIQMLRSFVAGQPVGLANRRNNCWINSSLQLLAHVPAFHPTLRRLPIFAQFLDQYTAAQQASQRIATMNSQLIREDLSNRGVIEGGAQQLDAAQLFEYIFEGQNALYTLKQRVNDAEATEHKEPMIQVNIGRHGPRPSFQELFNAYFDRHVSADQHIRLFFESSPDRLLIQLQRFYHERNAAGNFEQGRIGDPVNITEQIELPERFVNSHERAIYTCDAFLVHAGDSLNEGHYVAYIKKGDAWWLCSDTSVYEVPTSTALNALRKSYICHFKKVPLPS